MMLWKKLSLLAAVLVLIASLLMGCVSTEKRYTPAEDEEIFGTWINNDYKGRGDKNYMVIMKPDLTYELYSKKGRPAILKHSYILEKKWTDSDGNIWYRVRKNIPFDYEWQLTRISADGKTYEYAYEQGWPPAYPLEKMLASSNIKYRTYEKQ